MIDPEKEFYELYWQCVKRILVELCGLSEGESKRRIMSFIVKSLEALGEDDFEVVYHSNPSEYAFVLSDEPDLIKVGEAPYVETSEGIWLEKNRQRIREIESHSWQPVNEGT
jgi:hypothetical protein